MKKDIENMELAEIEEKARTILEIHSNAGDKLIRCELFPTPTGVGVRSTWLDAYRYQQRSYAYFRDQQEAQAFRDAMLKKGKAQ